MSKAYREYNGIVGESTTDPDMRNFCQRPGRIDKDGNPEYFTEQNHKKECDVNLIIKKYDRTGLIEHVSRFEAKYGDMTGFDFKTMQDKVKNMENIFGQLPAEIRKRFANTPEKLLEFMEDENNRPEAIKLGLIDPEWDELTDGLGEHVKQGENVKKDDVVNKDAPLKES